MAVEIAWDAHQQIALYWDNTTDTAFGPVFSGPSADSEAQEFLDWLKENGDPGWAVAVVGLGMDGTDPRHYHAAELERLVRHWCDLPTLEG